MLPRRRNTVATIMRTSARSRSGSASRPGRVEWSRAPSSGRWRCSTSTSACAARRRAERPGTSDCAPGAAFTGSAQPQGPRARARCQGFLGASAANGVIRPVAPISCAIASSAAMRFSVAGWVENRLSMRAPDSGLTMKRCAVAGLRSAASFGVCWAACGSWQAPRPAPAAAGNLGAAAVGVVFARAADRHLHQHGGERRQDHHGEHADDAERVVVVAVAAEEQAEIAPASRSRRRSSR